MLWFIYWFSRLDKKKAIKNPQNKCDKYFQYATTVELNYGEFKWNPERVLNIKPFINKYNWHGKKYLLKIDDWETFEKNNPKISLYFKD